MALLTITIPTFNRYKLLEENLNCLIPQVMDSDIEIVVFDNNSTDSTEDVVKEAIKRCSNIRYVKNESNIGYVGNQVNCLASGNGQYTAILCDDDIYLSNAINVITRILNSEKIYSFLALNYYSFKTDYRNPNKTNFAPNLDKEFTRGYDIMNHASVGHFSGFIYNSKLAKDTLNLLLMEYGEDLRENFEYHRGIFSHVANLMLSRTTLPSYFIGEPIFAAREPEFVDYDLLYHLNYNYLFYFNDLYKNGVINIDDYNYRLKIVLSSLPKALFIESSNKSRSEYDILKCKFDELLVNNNYYLIFIRPLFRISQNYFIKYVWKSFYKYYRINK